MESIQDVQVVDVQPVVELTIEELTDLNGGAAEAVASGTTNCGGSFGTATCPSTLGTSFSFT